MVLFRHAFLAAASLAAATGAVATVTPAHVYTLDNTLTDALGGQSIALVGGAALGANGVTFTQNTGLSLDGSAFADSAKYSVELYFRFDAFVVGSTGAGVDMDYSRILNSSGNDAGLYARDSGGSTGVVTFYDHGPNDSGASMTLGQMAHIVFTRDTVNQNVFFNGVNVLSMGSLGSSAINGSMKFFLDELAENGSGYVDFIRTYDGVLDATDVQALYNGGSPSAVAGVPEPASWALMLVGFGAIGAVARRRRTILA